MCAITGIIAKGKERYIQTEELFKMCRIQRHRGPDDEGGVALDLNGSKIREISSGETIACKGLLGFERPVSYTHLTLPTTSRV